MPEPYEPHDAITILRSILSNDGDLIIRKHCYIRMGKRKVDDLDIAKVLEENGIIQDLPELDTEQNRWKYRVDGYDADGEKLRVVVNIIEYTWRVVAISVVPHWKEKKK